MAAAMRQMLVVMTLVALVACSDDTSSTLPDDDCVEVFGSGTTAGTTETLMGSGMFTFDGVERPGDVALYVFNLQDQDDGSKTARLVYQFNWDNGDSFLTDDSNITLSPGLDPNTLTFTVIMTITLGSGIYEAFEGQKLFRLTGTLVFSPPAQPGDPMNAREEFDMSGLMCPA